MSITYDIRNLQNCQDYKQKREDFFRTLHLQQKLNRNYEQAMNQRSQMEKLGVQPVGEAPRSLEDEKKDLLLQQNLLLKNAMTLMKPEEARKLLFQLNNQEVYDFNTHFPALTEAVKGRKNISADFIKRVFHRYLLVLKATGGTGVAIPLSEETLAKLPADIIDAWENYARGSIDPTTGSPVNMDDLIRNTAAALNRTPADVSAEVKMEIDQEAQTDVPIQQLLKRKRGEVEQEARKRAKQVQTGEAEMASLEEPRGLKRVKEEELFLPSKKFKVSEETKGSLKRRKEEETEIIQEAIKRSREGPGPDPLPFRRGQKRLSRSTLEAELIKRQKMTEMSKKRAGEPLTRQERPSKKLKEMYQGAESLATTSRYLTPTGEQVPLEEAFMGYTPVSPLEEAKAQATRAIKRRATMRAKEVMEGRKETPLQKAKREAREAIQARAEMRARALHAQSQGLSRELGGGLFISPQESSQKNYSFIQTMGGNIANSRKGLVKMGARLIGSGIQPLTEERYRQFGKYSIHMPSLNKGIMKIANVSRKHMMPPKMVSQKFVHLIYKLLDDGVLDKTLYNGLDSEEQQYLIQASRLCKIDGFGMKLTAQEEEDIKKFELLKGTVIAGNNDPTTLDELKKYILKFIHTGQIDRSFGQSLLCEIACLA